ncbi:hypothetical protein BJV82DRAFT_599276 [Fennellomyces sp. T-0311]|nr:hypothetical protein BJV82DRAFT_599276 [Fennellomyces sp. T-0311]
MRGRLPADYPPWHPVIHHSLVMCFLLMMVLLPVLYIRTRQPPYWVLLVVLCSFVVIYIAYWIWLCCRSQRHDESENKPMDTVTIPDVSIYNPSTVGIPPSSYMVGHRLSSSSPSTLRVHELGNAQSFQQSQQQQQQRTQSVRSYSISSTSDHPPPPAYHLSFEHVAVELPQHPSPPSYHSAKDDDEGDRQSRRNHHSY